MSNNKIVTQRDIHISALNDVISKKNEQIFHLNDIIHGRDKDIVFLQQKLDEATLRMEKILSSKSWQITKPLRFIRLMAFNIFYICSNLFVSFFNCFVLKITLIFSRSISKIASISTKYKSKPLTSYYTESPFVIAKKYKPSKHKVLAVVIHVFYIDLFDEMLTYLKNMEVPCKLYVTTPFKNVNQIEAMLENNVRDYYILPVKNHGRDVLPFLKIICKVMDGDHDYLLKLHTKKSPQLFNGDSWRIDIYNKLLLPHNAKWVLSLLSEHNDIGMVGPQGYVVSLVQCTKPSFLDKVLEVGFRLGNDKENSLKNSFCAGTMFYARITALKPLLNISFKESDFELESNQTDGTLAHIIERALALSVSAANQKLVSSNSCDYNGNYYKQTIYDLEEKDNEK